MTFTPNPFYDRRLELASRRFGIVGCGCQRVTRGDGIEAGVQLQCQPGLRRVDARRWPCVGPAAPPLAVALAAGPGRESDGGTGAGGGDAVLARRAEDPAGEHGCR